MRLFPSIAQFRAHPLVHGILSLHETLQIIRIIHRVEAKSSNRADDTSSGFSLGMKCPMPGMTRRATNLENAARSAGGDSTSGRAIPSSAPYNVIEGH